MQKRKLSVLHLIFFALTLHGQSNPPQEQWDEVVAFYDNQGIPQQFVDKWRPYTTPRAERQGGLHVLPELPLNPFPGINLDMDLAEMGMVSVVDFGADPGGSIDSTEAIQKAVDFASSHGMVTFFPEGTYTVSGTIKAWSLTRVGPSYEGGRIRREDFFVPVLVGSAAAASRPVIRLEPGSFPQHVENDRRFVVEFRNFIPPSTNTFTDENGQTRFLYELGPERLESTARERMRENTPDHIGPEFRGIDIEIAENNAGASGLRFPTAETSGVGDVEIRFLGDGHVGFQGPPGGGSASVNITIIGGRIGLDTTNQSEATNNFPASGTGTQPTPTLTGLRLINQTELAVRSQVRGTIVGVGWHIETQLNGPVIMLRHSWYGDPFSSSFALIDSTIIYNTEKPFGNVVIGRHGDVEDRNRSFSLDNVYVKNAESAYVSNNLSNNTFATNPIGWFHINRLAYERRPRPRDGYDLYEQVYIDGQLHDTWIFSGTPLAPSVQPPTDLISRHIYAGDFPHFEVPGAVNIKDHGAVGDAVADDTAAIRAAVAAAAANGSNVVFVPRGYFKVSDTIDLLPDTKLIGLNRQWSVITSSQADGVFGNAEKRSDYPEGIPMIRTVDSPNADTVIAHLRLGVGFPIKTHNGWYSWSSTDGIQPDYTQDGAIPPEEAVVEVYPLHWRSGGTSVVRECMFNPRNEFNFHFNLYDEGTYSGAVFLHPLILMNGNAGGRWYGFHFHGYYPFGPEGELIRISDNQNPIHFYHLHAQHNTALNLIKLQDARYVSIYGVKTEHHKTLLRSIDSEHVRIFGHGGIATPAPGGQHYYFQDNHNFLISAIGDEIRFGNDQIIGSGWSIMYFTNFENYNLLIDRQGADELSPPFNERPILYQRGNPHAGSPVHALTTHNITFSAGANGSVGGELTQQVAASASSGVVTAIAQEGYSFAGWAGDYSGRENPLYLRDVQGDMNITAQFQPANAAPVVAILYPQQGTVLYAGESVTLRASATDAEDGDLTADGVWTSNRDGMLGDGDGVSINSLSTGLHQLGFSVTDSANQTTTATSLIWVQSGAIVVPDTLGTSPGSNTPWLPTRILAPDLTYDGLVRGAGLSGQATDDVFEVRQGAPGDDGADLAYVLANNQYLGFTITPGAEHPIDLNGARFSFSVSRLGNNTAASHYALFTSIDGFTAGEEIGIAVHPGPAADYITLTYTLAGSRFDAIAGPVEFRIYPHVANWGRNLAFKDFALHHDSTAGGSDDGGGDPAGPKVYYLHAGNGNDTNDGLGVNTAWESFQHAVDTLQPGDTLMIRDGDYHSSGNDEYKNWDITISGTPENPITIRAYPGERPRFHVDTWNGIQLWNVAHLELDGLEIIGLPDPEWLAAEPDNSDARKTLAEDRRYFGNGITVTHNGSVPHFISIRNNLVHRVGGNGISIRGGNRYLIEGNTVHDSTHRSDAGNSAISFIELNSAIHPSTGHGVVVRGNVLHNNRNRVAFKHVGYITDGNGVIIDYCQNYTGDRILIANNVAFHNGGRAIHVYNGRNVDVIHNTAYHNLQSEDVQWGGELSSDAPSGEANDSIRVFNNIAVAAPDRRAYHVVNTTNGEFTHNLVSSQRAPAHPVDATLNIIDMDPVFVDPAALDFRLQAGSPALDAGLPFTFILTDINGNQRVQGSAPDLGAYEGAVTTGPEPGTETVFIGGNVGVSSQWTNGLPLIGERNGEISVDGTINANINGWEVRQSGGILIGNATRILTDSTQWLLTGGSLQFSGTDELRVDQGAVLTVDGGTISVIDDIRIGASASATIDLVNGSISTNRLIGGLPSRLNISGGSLNLIAGTLAQPEYSPNSLAVNFTAESTGSFLFQGWGKSEFIQQYNNGKLLYDGSNTIPFDEVFIVSGSTLRLIDSGPALSAYEQWAADNDIIGDATDLTGGIANLFRYAFGGNATTPLSELLPVVQFLPNGAGDPTVTVNFNRIDDPDIHYAIWASLDLVDWGAEPVWSESGDGSSSVDIPFPNSHRGFIRMEVNSSAID